MSGHPSSARKAADARTALEKQTLLTVGQAAQDLGTSERFIRRLIAERRIAFVKLGRHVRISSADLQDFVSAGRIEPRRSPVATSSRRI